MLLLNQTVAKLHVLGARHTDPVLLRLLLGVHGVPVGAAEEPMPLQQRPCSVQVTPTCEPIRPVLRISFNFGSFSMTYVAWRSFSNQHYYICVFFNRTDSWPISLLHCNLAG
jgi:hypothetical protein